MKTQNCFRQKMLITGILFILSGTLIHCSALKKADAALDASAKELKPTSDKALVYIMRPSSYGWAINMDIYCNEKRLGTIGAKRFLYAFLDPGSYDFTIKGAENNVVFTFGFEAGQTYFLEQKIIPGWFSAGSKLVQLNADKGSQKLTRCSLSSKIVTKEAAFSDN